MDSSRPGEEPSTRSVATAVPEPSTLVLLGIGGVFAGVVARRRQERRHTAILNDVAIPAQKR